MNAPSGNLLPHEQRVMDEKMALVTKITDLDRFFSTTTFHNLSDEERSLLQRQIICMRAYADVLSDRIVLFLKGKP